MPDGWRLGVKSLGKNHRCKCEEPLTLHLSYSRGQEIVRARGARMCALLKGEVSIQLEIQNDIAWFFKKLAANSKLKHFVDQYSAGRASCLWATGVSKLFFVKGQMANLLWLCGRNCHTTQFCLCRGQQPQMMCKWWAVFQLSLSYGHRNFNSIEFSHVFKHCSFDFVFQPIKSQHCFWLMGSTKLGPRFGLRANSPNLDWSMPAAQ